MPDKPAGVDPRAVEGTIFSLRGQKVILDSDLARVYGVSTKALNQAVKRNIYRFPLDFAFLLTSQEASQMRSQIVTASKRNVRHRPWAFTEHGAIMAANVLNSGQAVRMSVYVVRAFVRLREALSLHKDLARRLEDLEGKYGVHDAQFQAVFDAIRELMKTPEKPKKRIGFLEEPRTAYRVVQRNSFGKV